MSFLVIMSNLLEPLEPLEKNLLGFLRKSCFDKSLKTVPKGLYLTLKEVIQRGIQRGS